VTSSGGDGTGTVTVTSVTLRDCNNAPIRSDAGAPATMTIDTAGPVAVANLGATVVPSGNLSGGTMGITVTFTPPVDASVIRVYRAPYGTPLGANAYPEYDDMPGAGIPAVPSYPPAVPWTLTSVAHSGDVDLPPARGYWYYVVFTQDACGNVSAVSNETAGTRNYLLGDVAGGVSGLGDNDVEGVDVSALGSHYGISLVYNDPANYLDVGPTSDASVNGFPVTDNRIDFEDLMIFAMNYGTHSYGLPTPGAPVAVTDISRQHPYLSLVPVASGQPGTVTARLLLQGNENLVAGLHAVVAFDASRLQLVSANPGGLLSGNGTFFKQISDPAGLALDAAVLGGSHTLSGSGEVAVLTFRATGAASTPSLRSSDLRDARNRSLTGAPQSALLARPQAQAPASGGSLPSRIELVGAQPNPFDGATTIRFRLPATSEVTLAIYDLQGRLVRTLLQGSAAAGDRSVVWDGRDAHGRKAGIGIYLCILQSGDARFSQKLFQYR